MQNIRCDLCVIGGGSGGLSVAAGAAQMGAQVVLFEGHRMGGDCLNTGCVPSKTLLSAAKAAHQSDPNPAERYAKAKARVRDVIAAIAPHDSVERFEGLGVQVIEDYGVFQDAHHVTGDGYCVKARRVVIATGSRPRIPPITGLDAVNYWTSDSIFESDEFPESLVVLGGGAIGLEMAQAHALLGSTVTVVEPFAMMGRDEPSLVEELRMTLESAGIRFVLGVAVDSVEQSNGQTHVGLASGETISCQRLLVATGRAPNVERLALEAAGIVSGPRGVVTDLRLRTNHRHIFAIGDVAGREAFTHAAGAHASVVVKQALFGLPAKATQVIPWVTYTDPELAHAGLTKAERDAAYPGDAQHTLEIPFSDIDRARCEHKTVGRIQVVTDRKGRILSADILGQHAGELILPWVLAIEQNIPLSKLASTVVPYPTRSEISKRVAGSYFTDRLFSDRTRMVVRWIQRLLP
jgi:pyruvate/2-oxoglutarate dehydrogenase complex dihydrolipoamide dehydrogenase (E3) component